MATYSEMTFNSQHYDDSRPNYPQPFYKELIKYHTKKGDAKLAIDIGCGSGFVAFQLVNYFDSIIGTDPSSTMIEQCNSNIPPEWLRNSPKKISFMKGTAEHHPVSIKENSVDLITGAECCHWVNHKQFFDESYRVLKSNGTLAYWFYKDPVFIGYPEANKVYTNYTYNSSFDESPDEEFERYMGPYYQQPGHDYLRSLMKEIEVPTDKFYDIVRHEYISNIHGAPKENEDPYITKTPLFIKKTITMKWFLDYVKSWSAYHTWMTHHGDKYDIAEKFVAELKQKMNWNDDTEIDVIWDTVYTFARKK